jgi:hypothetical protein
LAEATSEHGAGSDGENPFDGSGDSENGSDNGGPLKIAAKATLAGVRYDFGQSTVTRAHVMALECFTRYFPKGFA